MGDSDKPAISKEGLEALDQHLIETRDKPPDEREEPAWPCHLCNFKLLPESYSSDLDYEGLCPFDYKYRPASYWSSSANAKERCKRWVPSVEDLSNDARQQAANRILDVKARAKERRDDIKLTVTLLFVGTVFGSALTAIVQIIVHYITKAT